jgi:hypothetical protein
LWRYLLADLSFPVDADFDFLQDLALALRRGLEMLRLVRKETEAQFDMLV